MLIVDINTTVCAPRDKQNWFYSFNFLFSYPRKAVYNTIILFYTLTQFPFSKAKLIYQRQESLKIYQVFFNQIFFRGTAFMLIRTSVCRFGTYLIFCMGLTLLSYKFLKYLIFISFNNAIVFHFVTYSSWVIRDKTMDDKLMYTPMILNKITTYVDDNYWKISLDNAIINTIPKSTQYL